VSGARQVVNCMNCGEEATTSWEGVPVCGDCARIATHIVDVARVKFALLLTVWKDSVRAKLVEGRLVLGNEAQDPSARGVPPEMPGVSEGPGDGGCGEPEPR